MKQCYLIERVAGMDKDVTVIERRIYSLRVQNNLTQNELATKLNVSRSLVNNWENGYANISLKQLIKLAYIYQVPIDYLLGIIDSIDTYPYTFKQDMNLKIIGENIKNLRKSLGLTQEKFAIKIDTKRSSISYYETGKMMISTADIKQICETFGVSADYLVGNINVFIGRKKKAKIKTRDIKEKINI